MSLFAVSKKITLLSALYCANAIAGTAIPADGGNIISFAVQNSQHITNDQAFAVLSKTVQAPTAAALAKQTNPIINQALAIAKKYPSVKVSTGQPSAYPNYDNKGNITGMTAQARLNLSTQNSDDLSALIGELQGLLVLEQMYFDVSPAIKEQVQQQLMVSTSQKFQAQAEQVAKAWGAKGYRLVQANLDQGDTPYRPMAAMMSLKHSDSPQTLEAGDTELTYRINGSIFLVY